MDSKINVVKKDILVADSTKKTKRIKIPKDKILNLWNSKRLANQVMLDYSKQIPELFISLEELPENLKNPLIIGNPIEALLSPVISAVKPTNLIEKSKVIKRKFVPKSPFVNSKLGKTPSERIWFYIDEFGKTQGPFTSLEMDKWFDGGYFYNELLIRFKEAGDFVKLVDLLGKTETITSGKEGDEDLTKQKKKKISNDHLDQPSKLSGSSNPTHKGSTAHDEQVPIIMQGTTTSTTHHKGLHTNDVAKGGSKQAISSGSGSGSGSTGGGNSIGEIKRSNITRKEAVNKEKDHEKNIMSGQAQNTQQQQEHHNQEQNITKSHADKHENEHSDQIIRINPVELTKNEVVLVAVEHSQAGKEVITNDESKKSKNFESQSEQPQNTKLAENSENTGEKIPELTHKKEEEQSLNQRSNEKNVEIKIETSPQSLVIESVKESNIQTTTSIADSKNSIAIVQSPLMQVDTNNNEKEKKTKDVLNIHNDPDEWPDPNQASTIQYNKKKKQKQSKKKQNIVDQHYEIRDVVVITPPVSKTQLDSASNRHTKQASPGKSMPTATAQSKQILTGQSVQATHEQSLQVPIEESIQITNIQPEKIQPVQANPISVENPKQVKIEEMIEVTNTATVISQKSSDKPNIAFEPIASPEIPPIVEIMPKNIADEEQAKKDEPIDIPNEQSSVQKNEKEEGISGDFIQVSSSKKGKETKAAASKKKKVIAKWEGEESKVPETKEPVVIPVIEPTPSKINEVKEDFPSLNEVFPKPQKASVPVKKNDTIQADQNNTTVPEKVNPIFSEASFPSLGESFAPKDIKIPKNPKSQIKKEPEEKKSAKKGNSGSNASTKDNKKSDSKTEASRLDPKYVEDFPAL